MLLEFSRPPASQGLCSMYHRVIFLENSSDLDASCMWLGTSLSSDLVFISSVKWRRGVGQQLSEIPASLRIDHPVILSCFQGHGHGEECLQRSWFLSRRLCSRGGDQCALAVAIFRIVLCEQPFQKRYFRMHLSPHNQWGRKGKHAEIAKTSL